MVPSATLLGDMSLMTASPTRWGIARAPFSIVFCLYNFTVTALVYHTGGPTDRSAKVHGRRLWPFPFVMMFDIVRPLEAPSKDPAPTSP